MTIFFTELFFGNFLSFMMSEAIVLILRIKFCISDFNKILFSTKEFKISMAIKPDLANPANGSVPYLFYNLL